MTTLRAGVFGCGPEGLWSVAQALQQLSPEDCRLVAAGDVEAAARARFTAATGISLVADSFEDLLATGIDFVVLAGPRRDRLRQVQLAAEQGVHCLLHAPMAQNATDAAAMISCCEAAQLQLGVLVRGQQDPVFEQVRQMIAADWLGGLVHVQSLVGDDDLLLHPPAADDARLHSGMAGHPLLQLASHHVHLMSWLLGRDAVSVNAQATKGFLPLPADGAVATAVLRGNVLCTFVASHLMRGNTLAIHGNDGFVRICPERIVMRGPRQFSGHVFDYAEGGREQSLHRSDIALAVEAETADAELHGRFARSIDDRDDFPCRGEQALLDMRTLDAMARAMASGHREAVA